MWKALLVGLLLQVGPQPGPDRVSTANRDSWQRPNSVMDALGVTKGTRVADIGAGEGYFTFRLARRVGPTGRIYAEDIVGFALDDIARRASQQGLKQIVTVHGSDEDPMLPPGGVDVVLVVNSYHEFKAFDAMMQGFQRALKPRGLLGIIEPDALKGEQPGSAFRHHRISSDVVRDDAARAGLRFARSEIGFVNPAAGIDSPYWFFLIFQKPG